MKATWGNFFEDFRIGQVLRHATPRTITAGDVSLYAALYGSRIAVHSSEVFARALGYRAAPVDDLLVFHIVFGKSVPDISLNAIANLGYAECRFREPVFAGDTIRAESEVIGLKQNSSGDSGVVWVRTTGTNQQGTVVLDYVRWVMVRKRNRAAPAPTTVVPGLGERVEPASLGSGVPRLDIAAWDKALAGSPWGFKDFKPGERIDHVDGFTIEEAEHQMATRLYQNTARVHFNAHAQEQTKIGQRLVYGGVIMSIARSLSFNGLGCAFHVAAINGGRHIAPCTAGDTVTAATEILECAEIPGRRDIGMLRVRSTASAVRPRSSGGSRDPEPVLELDMWLASPNLL